MPAKCCMLFQRCFRSVASNYTRLPIVDGFKMSNVDSVLCCCVNERWCSVLASHQDGEVLEAGTKKFEDLEFQQLERESSLEEERETMSQQLLQERAEYHNSVAKRKVRKHHTYCRPSAVEQYAHYGLKNICSGLGRAHSVVYAHTAGREAAVEHASTIWRRFAYFLTAEATSLQEFYISLRQLFDLHQQNTSNDIWCYHTEVLSHFCHIFILHCHILPLRYLQSYTTHSMLFSKWILEMSSFCVISFRIRCLLWRTRPTSSACRLLRSVSGWPKTGPSLCKCSRR